MKNITKLATYAILVMVCGCANLQRSLVFSTGTTIGIEVAVSPESEAPVDILIGYKRAEVLFDPIMNDTETNADKENRVTYEIMPKAHSVIAKLQGKVNTKGRTGAGPEADAGLTVAQWFASGKAAEILAEKGGAAALTDSPAVAKAVANAATLTSTKGEIPDIVFSLTNQLFQEISNLRNNASSTEIKNQAGRLYHSLNDSALVAKVPATFTRYVPGPTVDKTITFSKKEDRLGGATGFQRVINYRSRLSSSVNHLGKLRDAIIDGSITIADYTSSSPTNADKNAKDALLKVYELQEKALKDWEEAITKDSQVIAMWRFLGGE